MKSAFVPSTLIASLALLGGCASMGSSVPAGLEAGKFVRLTCAGNSSFQARVSEDGRSVRVRALHGSAELDAKGSGVFEGEGYVLRTEGDGAISLDHAGKSQGRQCKPAA